MDYRTQRHWGSEANHEIKLKIIQETKKILEQPVQKMFANNIRNTLYELHGGKEDYNEWVQKQQEESFTRNTNPFN